MVFTSVVHRVENESTIRLHSPVSYGGNGFGVTFSSEEAAVAVSIFHKDEDCIALENLILIEI